jgi:hypothetical protein
MTDLNGATMTQPGVLERIATALETIAAMLTGETPTTPAARTPRHPETRFEWEPAADQAPAAPLPEPTPPEERCGFLIEKYTHPLDRVTPVYQISKAGATILLTEQEATALAALSDEEFTGVMAARLAEVLAQRHAAAAATPAPSAADDIEDEDEARERQWARTFNAHPDPDEAART